MMNVRLRGFQSHKVGHSNVKEKNGEFGNFTPETHHPQKG
jgi:hypothetical protein